MVVSFDAVIDQGVVINAERSRAGSVTPGAQRDELPASADTIGWASLYLTRDSLRAWQSPEQSQKHTKERQSQKYGEASDARRCKCGISIFIMDVDCRSATSKEVVAD